MSFGQFFLYYLACNAIMWVALIPLKLLVSK